MIFVQRDGTTGSVGFTGDEARVLDATGNVVVGWTSGGTIGGIPQGDGYSLEVRTGTAVTSEPLAVGIVAFVMGQSNIQRWFDDPSLPTSTSGIYAMESDGDIVGVSGGAAQHFAEVLTAEAGVPVMMVEGARGGTSLLQSADKGSGNWMSTAPGSLYATALTLLAAVGGKVEVVLWAQGETDASANVTTPEYAAALTEFMNRVLADFDPVHGVLIQEIGPRGSNDGKYDEVRDAQHQVAAALDGVAFGALTLDLNTVADGVHLSGASRVLAADRMVISTLAELGIDLSRGVVAGTDDALLGDTLVGGAGRDELRGLAGDDLLEGGAGSDVLLGGAGRDTLDGGAGVDILRGGAGDDVVDGGADDDVISGGDGHDTLSGGAGNDEIWADAGDDVISGGAGDDLLLGEGGFDAAVYAGNRAGYVITVSAGFVSVSDIDLTDGDEGTDTLFSIESLRFADMVVDPAGPGLQQLFTEGGDFVDFASVPAASFAVESYHAALGGNDVVILPANAAAAAAAGYVTTRVFDAGPGTDVVTGGALDDTIFGGTGNDTLSGGAGDDVLDGGSGADRLNGGTGNDIFYVNNSADIVFERPDEGYDIVRSVISFRLKSNLEELILDSVNNSSGSGNASDNVITGNAGNNKLLGYEGADTLIGNEGNDQLNGGTGIDSMVGGLGNDRYWVDDVLDVIIELPDEGYDRVDSTISFTLADGLERLSLLGSDHISGTGNGVDNRIDGNAGDNAIAGMGGTDRLFGGAGRDTLDGGDGNDFVEGGLGEDLLIGGAGNDRFIFRSMAEIGGGSTGLPSDRIADFVSGDRIDISRIDAVAGTSASEPFVFRGATTLLNAGEVGYEHDLEANLTRLLGHVDNDGNADFVLVVSGLVDFVKNDIAL